MWIATMKSTILTFISLSALGEELENVLELSSEGSYAKREQDRANNTICST